MVRTKRFGVVLLLGAIVASGVLPASAASPEKLIGDSVAVLMTSFSGQFAARPVVCRCIAKLSVYGQVVRSMSLRNTSASRSIAQVMRLASMLA